MRIIFGEKYCEWQSNPLDSCGFMAKLQIERPNPVNPNEYPKYFCYSHTSSFIRTADGGQFLVTRLEE